MRSPLYQAISVPFPAGPPLLPVRSRFHHLTANWTRSLACKRAQIEIPHLWGSLRCFVFFRVHERDVPSAASPTSHSVLKQALQRAGTRSYERCLPRISSSCLIFSVLPSDDKLFYSGKQSVPSTSPPRSLGIHRCCGYKYALLPLLAPCIQ